MASLKQIPPTAVPLIEAFGVIQYEQPAHCDCCLMQAERSEGFRQGYQLKPEYFLVVRVEGARPFVKRFSDREYSLALKEWNDIQNTLTRR
jgi:hypothetical protein